MIMTMLMRGMKTKRSPLRGLLAYYSVIFSMLFLWAGLCELTKTHGIQGIGLIYFCMSSTAVLVGLSKNRH